jgi:protein-S-isoprenylcysteine O-methyltransferase Ste14
MTAGGNVEIFYRVSVGIIYFFQVVALIFFYRRTNDKKILYDTARETSLFITIRSMWVISVILSILLYMLFPASLEWGKFKVQNSVRVFGIVSGIGTDILILWILASLGKNISAALKVRESQQLVTHGPYRYVRHPLYSAGLLLFFSIALISSNWFLGLIGISFQLFIMYIRTPLEEEMLIEHFGEEYLNYIKRTGAHFPKIAACK